MTYPCISSQKSRNFKETLPGKGGELILAPTAGNEGPGRHVMDTLEGRCMGVLVSAVAMKKDEKIITLET
jgi:hypothetical protein